METEGWRTSSRCEGGACIEIAGDWRKSARSVNNGECVEAASAVAGIAVRDTTDRDGTVLTFGAGTWTAFTEAVKAA